MRRISVKPEKPTILDGEIEKQKPEFQSLLKSYLRLKLTNLFYKVFIVILIGSALFILTYSLTLKNNEVGDNVINDTLYEYNQDVIDNGLFGDYPTEIFMINPKIFNTLKTKNNTIIKIPENSFNDNSDSIKIIIKEFLNPIDMLKGNISLRYDSLGVEYFLESAGMIEIYAYDNDTLVELIDNKEINITFLSEKNCNLYNVYYYNNEDKNWDYLGKDVVSNNQSKDKKPRSQNLNNFDEQDEKLPFLEPRLLNKSKHLFNIEYDTIAFPEFLVYSKVLFEINESKQEFKKDWYLINWDKIQLVRKSIKNNQYLIALSKKDSIVFLDAHAVQDEKEYKAALQSVNRNTKNSSVKSDDDGIMNTAVSLTNEYSRSFSINMFGLWNIDKPIPPVKLMAISNPKLIDLENGNLIKSDIIYSIGMFQNTLINNNPNEIKCFLKNDNITVAILQDKKMFISNTWIADKKSKKVEIQGNIYSYQDGFKHLNRVYF